MSESEILFVDNPYADAMEAVKSRVALSDFSSELI
jgi:hypothetical protein